MKMRKEYRDCLNTLRTLKDLEQKVMEKVIEEWYENDVIGWDERVKLLNMNSIAR